MTPSSKGIYTLGNDVVLDQVIALLNSIDANVGSHIPVIICPYDHRLERLKEAIANRPNVSIFDDQAAIARWDEFAVKLWQTHPIIKEEWQQDGLFQVYRLGMHRRFCCLDGPLEHYIYLDADTLVLNSLQDIFAPLQTYDWVVYDFQHNDPTHVFNVNSPKLAECFDREHIYNSIFCAGMYASRSGLFSREQCDQFLEYLATGEADILYPKAPDQSILNYMVMRSKIPVYNLAHHLPPDQVTGCCVTSNHFQSRNHTLYDGNTPLTYIHYIGISSSAFTRLCAGENLDIPYRDLFLHYRYLHTPDQIPTLAGKFKPYNPPPTFRQKISRKIGQLKLKV